MAEYYDEDMLREINKNVDLLQYVSQTIELTKKGNDYFGRCPLHVDNTPSFSITPSKNAYYCFSCGKSGYIINFLMDYEHLNFKEAIEKASKLAHIDINKMCKSNTVSFLKTIRAMKLKPNSQFHHEILPLSELEKYSKEPVQEWLNEGIEQWVMDIFQIRSDKRQNRIIYPVYDIEGNLINIKARTRYRNFKEMKIPKYINYYPVGVMDYFQALNITISYIKEKNEIIIFESVKSVMKAFGWGYKNCVSAEKHTLTKEQEELLVRMKVNVIFAYDADVNYFNSDVRKTLNRLKRVTNVYIIEDKKKLLGGVKSKNAPADCGKKIWEELYSNKRKIV